MDAATKRDIEDIKITLRGLEQEEERLVKELESVRRRKKDAHERLVKLSDDTKYQEEMLTMVYEQRHKAGNNSPKE